MITILNNFMYYFDAVVLFKEGIAILMKDDYHVSGFCNVYVGDQKCIRNFW
jgi:hypothetical protein